MWPFNKRKKKSADERIQENLQRVHDREQAQAAAERASFKEAFNKLASNGVIASLDALKAREGSKFDYSVHQNGAKAVIATNIPATVRFRSLKRDTAVTITGDAKGAVSVDGDALALVISGYSDHFDIKARKMKRGGNRRVAEFIAEKAHKAKLLPNQQP